MLFTYEYSETPNMENYELSFKDTFLGTLTVDAINGKYAFNPNMAGVDAVKEKTVLIREILEGTDSFRPPIPFFQSRIRDMKRSGLKELRYHTDYFILRKQK